MWWLFRKLYDLLLYIIRCAVFFWFKLIGYNGGKHLCDHKEFIVSDVRAERMEVNPITFYPNEKDKTVTMYTLKAKAKCKLCEYEFKTWANAEKITTKDDNNDNDLSGFKKIDDWRRPPYFM